LLALCSSVRAFPRLLGLNPNPRPKPQYQFSVISAQNAQQTDPPQEWCNEFLLGCVLFCWAIRSGGARAVGRADEPAGGLSDGRDGWSGQGPQLPVPPAHGAGSVHAGGVHGRGHRPAGAGGCVRVRVSVRVYRLGTCVREVGLLSTGAVCWFLCIPIILRS